MFWKTNLVLAASILSVTALPSGFLATRDDTQCDTGTEFYICSINGFRGCCSVNPCALPDGCPDDIQDDKPTLCNPGETVNILPPRQMKTFPEDSSEPSFSPDFYLTSSSETSSSRQTTTFYAPPEVVAAGKNCTLAWKVQKAPGRNFTVNGINGLVDVHDVDTGDFLGVTDMQNWDDDERFPDAHDISAGSFRCKEVMNVEFAHHTPKEGLDIFLEQNERNGWYLKYTC